MSGEILDLFGDPIPPEHVGRGRPPHVPDDKKRCKVMLLLALKRTEDDIAAVLGITGKTLRKHYSRELRVRDVARARLDAELWMQLLAEAAKGNVAAIDKAMKRFDKFDVQQLAPSALARQAKEPKLGKKEQRLADARTAGMGGSWGDLVGNRSVN